MPSIPCDVVLLPNELLAQSAEEASRELSNHGSLFTLKRGEYFPHISLYMLQLTTETIPEVETILAEIARTTAPPQLDANRYDQNGGYIDVEYQRVPIVDGLQEDVVKRLNPLRDGMRAKDAARLKDARGLKQANLQQYGYQSIGELFRPHMTFTRLESNKKVDLESGIGDAKRFSGPFMKIGLFEMGDNGTCVRQIATFGFLEQA